MAFTKKPSIAYWLGESLYLNITNQCPNNCYFCIRNFKRGVGGYNLKLEREPTLPEILSELQKVINLKNWREIVFCGFGEPTVRLDCLIQVSRWIKRHYYKIMRIRVDTNGQGYLLNMGRDVAKELKEAGIDKVSVSLNAPDRKTYNEICRPKFENAFESILAFIEQAKKLLEVEVTAVALPEVDIDKVAEFAGKLKVNFRIREYIQCFW